MGHQARELGKKKKSPQKLSSQEKLGQQGYRVEGKGMNPLSNREQARMRWGGGHRRPSEALVLQDTACPPHCF